MIDTHTHIDLISDDPSLQDQAVSEALSEGIRLMINIGVDKARLTSCKAISERHPQVFHTAGYHPEILNETGQEIDMSALEQSIAHSKCLGIGEVGLDYFHNQENKEAQARLFTEQLDLAVSSKMPVILHIRDAWEDALSILSSYADRLTGIFHCFTGTKTEAKRCLDLGFFISFAGMLTYKNADPISEAALYVPLERAFLETDAPFLAPVPMRGKPNRPAYVRHLYDFYSQLREIPRDELAEIHMRSLKGLFSKFT